MQGPLTALSESADDVLEEVTGKSVRVGEDVMQIDVAGSWPAALRRFVGPPVETRQQVTLADSCTAEQCDAGAGPCVEGMASKAGETIKSRSMDFRNIDIVQRWLSDPIRREGVRLADGGKESLEPWGVTPACQGGLSLILGLSGMRHWGYLREA